LNKPLSQIQFPLRALSDPLNRNSTVLWDTSMRVGSAGTFRRTFDGVVEGQAEEAGADALDKPEFMVGGLQVRRVTSRNAPSVINAVFSVRSFWDGRAQRIFNGFTPSGNAADGPGALVMRDGELVREAVRLDNSGLASQAVGPVMDHLEMSYAGRTWQTLGRKLLSLAPLGLQRVSVNDSVLGAMANAEGPGLAAQHTYRSMIEEAFVSRLTEGGNSQMEENFSVFWGLALQAYQATLVSADSPFDRFMEGNNAALTAQEREGMQLYQGNARCNTCHGGAELSGASFTASGNGGRGNRAFQRTGVRPANEDAGSGGGNFKSIGLRNLEFTGPYFHNGGAATIEQAVEFYARGGDFNPTNNVRAFNTSAAQRDSLAAFLRNAVTDERVRFERAPFDHPELCVPVGHVEPAPGMLTPGAPGPFRASAAERWRLVPAVGAGGNQVPLRTFEEMIRGMGGNGARAHALDEACPF
jgi:cytochrome c peroxidase